jgi:hypothetical protein
MKLENVDFCGGLKNIKDNKWLETFLFTVNSVATGIVPEKCPVTGVRITRLNVKLWLEIAFPCIETSNRQRFNAI